jgi:hypothetical protein
MKQKFSIETLVFAPMPADMPHNPEITALRKNNASINASLRTYAASEVGRRACSNHEAPNADYIRCITGTYYGWMK